MKIYTSCFGRMRQISDANLTPIGIAIYPPKWYKGLNYKALAPDSATLRIGKSGDRVRYIERFRAIMDKLDPDTVMRDLESMKLKGTKGIALLCFEAPGEFCHRHLVTQWLEDNFGKENAPTEFDAKDHGRNLTLLNNVTDD